FKELCTLLLAVDPDTPGKFADNYLKADDLTKRFYCLIFIAAGKTAVPLVVDRLAAEAVTMPTPTAEAWSLLPLVLAQPTVDALPDVRRLLSHPHPAVRRQAVRTLGLMGPGRA